MGSRAQKSRLGHKYKAKPGWDGCRYFASQAERDRGHELALLHPDTLVYQPRVHLVAGIHYKPDFSYIEDGRLIHEDVKGVLTDVFRLKKRLWRAFGPGLLRITKRRGKTFVVIEEIPGA